MPKRKGPSSKSASAPPSRISKRLNPKPASSAPSTTEPTNDTGTTQGSVVLPASANDLAQELIANSRDQAVADEDPPPYEAVVQERLEREHCRNGEVQATLIWNDCADLDLHAYCSCGAHIYFANRECICGGWLDRDMNRSVDPADFSLSPVENIFWASAPSGDFKITVHNFCNRTMPDTVFTDAQRRVPFRVKLKRGFGNSVKTIWFEGTVGPYETVECFSWINEGSGALGRMVVLNPLPNGGTFEEMCAAQRVTYQRGQGYYALVRKVEDVSAKKDMMLLNLASDTFTIGADACRSRLGLPLNTAVKVKPENVPDGHRLFIQSTSHNRKLPPGVHALMMVPTVEEALRFRRPRIF
ncbi:hypothetical protein HDU84_009348 [Entophlyctis sp. JEL0112]|nr:hypothetical protein HDU84_009348 [Entophlyctis sp. JEL0112]